jgi:hypothetical protein
MHSSYGVPGLESYKYPVVATLESKQPLFSPLAISVSPFLTSILALALVVSLALVAVVHSLYVVITIIQVTSIVAYIVTLGVRGDVLTQYIASTLLVLGR